MPPEEKPSQPQTSDSLYLEKLEFKPELRNSWLNFFVSNFRVVILLIILISAWGIYAYIQLPRESNPEVRIPYAVVITTFPGASPADVEELVTKKIETQISGIKDIKKITSTSSNSVSAISVEFEASANLDNSIRSLRDKVNSIHDLSTDVNTPIVNEISFDDTPIYTFSLTGPFDGFTLRSFAEKIQTELEKIPGVREVNISGGDTREFEVAYDPQKLTFYSLTAAQANQIISSTNVAIPSGNFEGQEYNYAIRTDARFFDEEKLKNIPLSHTNSGALVYLRDVANVQEHAIKKTVYSRLSSAGSVPQDAITVSIVKKTGSSILDAVSQAQTTIEEQIKTFPPGVSYEPTVNQAKIINKDFDQLTHDFLLTLLLVMGVLFLIVGLKEAIVAGLAIPLVFFTTFGVMQLTGTSLNFLSIFSLLLSLGLLVDDAIVVVSATKQYMKTGKYTPEEAVLLVLNDFKILLLTTTLATVWAFLPLLFASGIIGQFIKSIPITVSVTLISSLIIALIINHPLAAVLERIRLKKKFLFLYSFLILATGIFFMLQKSILGYIIFAVSIIAIIFILRWYRKGGKSKLEANAILVEQEWDNDELIKKKLLEQGTHEDEDFWGKLIHGVIPFHKIIPLYDKYLCLVLQTKKRRLTLLAATFAIFVAAMLLPILGIVPSEFFPNSDFDNLYVSIEAPTGLNLAETNKITQKVEEKLLKYPQIANFTTVVGAQGASPSQAGGGGVSQSSSHLSSIVITLVDAKQRTLKSYDIADQIRADFSDIKEATVSIESPRGGPPSGSAFEAHITGNDLQQLDAIAKDLKPILASIPGTANIDVSLKDAPAEYTFALDQERLELYSLNAASVGSTIRMAISGTKISTVLRNNKEIDVMARFDENKIPDLASVQNLQIGNLKGQPVFIKDVAQVKLNPTVESITRIDQNRVVLLTAGVTGTTNPTLVLKNFQDKLKASYKLPDGYSITYGGENEQNAESVLSIIRAMVIAAILIVSTLVIQFNSFKKAMIVLVTLPLALIGVFVGLAIFHLSLSFPGLIGILALFGIVVKNAIILIDKINLNLKFGIPFLDAIIDAGKSRLEAIFITSICTIFGIIPITLSNATWTSLGSAIIFGLMLSSFFTLFIVPTLFVTFIGEKERF